jgi:hypothetical protein
MSAPPLLNAAGRRRSPITLPGYLEETLWTPAEWRDGKCVSWANHGTQAEALEAVGLRE